jgi:hypothetical protein
VLATVLSLVSAMTIGFVGTVALGAAAYALAGWALVRREPGAVA